MTGDLIPAGLRNLIDCTPLDKFIKEQNPDLPNISNAIVLRGARKSLFSQSLRAGTEDPQQS